jgi:gliding motility-associated-like protein
MPFRFSGLLKSALFPLLFLIQLQISAQTYCNTTLFTTDGCTLDDYIESFSTTGGLENITNLNSLCGDLVGPGYTYYIGAGLRHKGIQQTSVNFEFTNNGSSAEGYKIWVDWNQNGDFSDVGDQVYSSQTVPTGLIYGGEVISGNFMIPAGATVGVTRMRIRCVYLTTGFNSCSVPTTQYSYGEVEDYDFEVVASTPCSGTPTASFAYSSKLACNGVPITLTYNGPVVTELTYRWQSSPFCQDNFINIPQATNSSYEISSVTGPTDYRLIVWCTNTGLSDTSEPFSVPGVCYCYSEAYSISRDDIGQLKIGNYTSPAIAPPLINNLASEGTYADSTGLPPLIFAPGNTYPLEMTQTNSGGYFKCWLKVFVDFNQDGDFDDPDETPYSQNGPNTSVAPTFTGTVTVPPGATPGHTIMRVMLRESGSAANVTPCAVFQFGHVLDYAVVIEPGTTISANVPVCENNTINLSSTVTGTCATTYSWSGPNGFASTAPNASIPAATAVNSGDYILTVSSFGFSSTPDTFNVTVHPHVQQSESVSICAGSSYQFGPTLLSTPGVYNHTFQTIYGCDSMVELTLSITQLPLAPAVSSPVSYCMGATAISLTATGTNLLWYTVPVNGTGSPTAPVPSTASATTTSYYVSQTVNGCEGPRSTIQVVVHPIPNISGATGNNPTSCGGNNGSITLQGLNPNTSYTSVSYTYNSGTVTLSLGTNATGMMTIPSLAAGTYSNISVTLNNCPSNLAGPVTLTDPAPPVVSASSNSPVCEGGSISLDASSLAGATYSWSGPSTFGSIQEDPTITGAAAANAGVYSVVATLNNCPSLPATTTVVVNLLPVAASSSITNPSACLASDGSIHLNGLIANTSYSVSYLQNTVPAGPLNISTDGAGTLTISGLTAGSYTNVLLTHNNCPSLPAGPFTLTDPAAPAIPVASNNGPVCSGQTLQLSASSDAGVSYTWTGPSTFGSGLQNPSIPNTQAVNAGVYSVTATLNNCTSAAGTTTVVVNQTPVISNTTFNNPTTCLGTDGYIRLHGLLALTSYLIDYQLGSVPQPQLSIATNNQGVITIPSLGAGTYTGITVTISNCTSAPAGPVVLTDPAPPAAPVANSNSPVCEGGVLNLTASTVATASYTWSGPSGFGASTQNATVNPVQLSNDGVYSVYITVNNCNSAPATTTVSITPLPAVPVAGSNSPVCPGGLLNLTASGIAGASYTWTGPSAFGSGLQNPTINPASATNAGVYTVTATVNNCTSAGGTTTVVVNPIPVIGGSSFVNPTTCTGTDGSITLAGLIASTTYSVNFSFNSGVQPMQTLTTNGAGSLTITGLSAGNYNNVTVTLGGCASAGAGPFLLSDPGAPPAPVVSSNGPLCEGATLNLTIPAVANAIYSWNGPATFGSSQQNPSISGVTTLNSGIYSVTATVNNCTSAPGTANVGIFAIPAISSTSSTNPTTCLGANGTITLNGLTASTSYAINYTNNTTPTGPVSISSNASGTVVITGLAVGTYDNITATLNGCTSPAVGPITLTGPVAPPVPVVNNNGPLCSGATLNLTASSSAGVTYTWTGPAFSSALQNPSITNAQTTNAGVYSVTATLNNCTSAAGTTTVVINQTPAAPGVSNIGYCQFSTASPLTATGQNLQWYTLPAGGTAQTTASTPSTATPTTINWYVSQTVNGCESARSTLIVTITAKPSAPVVTATLFYCQGQTAPALTATGSNLLWYTVATGGTGSSIAPVPSTATAGPLNWYVSQTVGGCESDRSSIAVTIGSTPANPTVTSPVNYCQFSPVSPALASFVSGTNVKWYTGPSGGTGSTVPPAVNTAVGSTTNYYVSSTTGTCESGRTLITVNVIPKPAVPVVQNDTAYCQGNVAAALTAAGQNLLWYAASSGGTGSTTAPVPSTAAIGGIYYYVSQTVNGCESDRDSILVTVFLQPGNPVVNPNTFTYCQFDPATPLNAAGQNLLWYTLPTGGTGTGSTPTPSTATAGLFNWYVSQSIGGCESNRSNIAVTVNAKPAPPLVDSPVLYCQGDLPSQLTATGQSLKWYNVPFGGTANLNAPMPSTAVITTTYYYVSQTIQNCESDRAVIGVTVNPKIDAIISASTVSVCQYDTVIIQDIGTAIPTAQYDWDFGSGNVISGTANGPYEVRWDVPGTYKVYLKVDNFNCGDQDSITIVVKPSPSASFNIQSDGCIGDTIKVIATGTAGISSFTWDFDGALKIGGTGAGYYYLRWDTEGPKYVSLVTFAQGCPSFVFLDTLTLHGPPVVDINFISRADICTGDTLTLGTQDVAGYQYLWTPERYISGNGNAAVTVTPQRTELIYLNLTDNYGCEGRDSIMVATHPCCEVYLPDAFTPNGDGRNDKFHVITMDRHQLTTFKVVNRWGQVMFDTNDEAEGWDGRYNGEPQQMGSYYYFLRFKCGENQFVEKKGEVMLVR